MTPPIDDRGDSADAISVDVLPSAHVIPSADVVPSADVIARDGRGADEPGLPPVPAGISMSAFESINLRWNPFGEPSFRERIELALARPIPVEPGTLVQIVAPEGMGKTSLLLGQLHFRQDAVYWRADRDGPAPRPRPSGGRALLLLDEADSLPRRRLARIIRPWTMVLAATHRDLSSWAKRPVKTMDMPALDRKTLRSIVARRLEWARLGPGPLPQVSEEFLGRLLDEHGGNLRALEDDLYEWFQDLKEKGRL